jgi:2',3'-cyclic-nucleotide 2'-phosphodiesterase (5'-nucleotidase family)
MPRPRRRSIALALATLLPALLGGSRGSAATSGAPAGRVVIVGVADLKGKTSPCGCHIPKGGFARMAAFLDSTRATGQPVLFVDAGGSFPEVDGRTDLAEFMYESLHTLVHADAVAVGPRDLREGLAFLRDLARRHHVPVTCANLVERAGRNPVFPTSLLIERGGVRIGVFALLGERFDLGPARDSLTVLDPETAATREVAALRARGAQLVVLLSQLGRVGGEDVATAVAGIDAVVLGHDIPILEQGRRMGDAIASYAGDQGQNVGVLSFALSPDGRASDGQSTVRTLGPDVHEQPAAFAAVKAFEDAYNERMRVEQRRIQALADADPDQDPVDHFVGGAVCARCHADEARQWETTAHSLAWETLVREKKDATPECIPCHSVGYRKPGGFQDAMQTPHLANVQCENCHGMGTLHRADGGPRPRVEELTCRGCHNAERDPEFDYAAKLPLMIHSNASGESIRIIQERRAKGYGAGGR